MNCIDYSCLSTQPSRHGNNEISMPSSPVGNITGNSFKILTVLNFSISFLKAAWTNSGNGFKTYILSWL